WPAVSGFSGGSSRSGSHDVAASSSAGHHPPDCSLPVVIDTPPSIPTLVQRQRAAPTFPPISPAHPGQDPHNCPYVVPREALLPHNCCAVVSILAGRGDLDRPQGTLDDHGRPD